MSSRRERYESLAITHYAAEAGYRVRLIYGSERMTDKKVGSSNAGDLTGDNRSATTRYSSRWLTILITFPSGARTKNLRTPHGSSVSGWTIS